MLYIWYSKATLCKNLPEEEIQQQISSEYPVKSFLMDLLSLYCQSQQISPQPERKQNLTIKKLLSHNQVTKKKNLPRKYKFNAIRITTLSQASQSTVLKTKLVIL